MNIVLDDLLLTKDMPTTAGSRMLADYRSLFDAEVIARLQAAGHTIVGKAAVGEFGIDLLGETSAAGALVENGALQNAAAAAVRSGKASAAICMDVNGYPSRAAAQSGLVSLKPTYGTVSRFGTIPVACSGETVSILAATVADCREALSAIVGHDDKDGTSLPASDCARVLNGADTVRKVAVLDVFGGDLSKAEQALQAAGVEVCHVAGEVFAAARAAWNILMSAELCNNVSRYDGVKYGHRAQNFTGIDELYTNSRTEAFGDLLKTVILFGSETLSTDNYMKVYDKALRVRRVIKEAFEALFAEYDALLLPAVSAEAYVPDTVDPFVENRFTAPASITGLPAVVAGGVQVIGNAFSENVLLHVAEKLS